MTTTPPTGPLTGIRIIEIEGIGPGPFAGMMLADLGADVIVVQRPGDGGGAILTERFLTDRGKRAISLDLKSDEGRDAVLSLIATADALIEGFRPGVMERLGLGPQPCHSVNPALVYGRMTGWGQTGPLAQTAGHDLNYLALSGALWSANLPGERPSVPPTLLGDLGGGALYLVTGLLAGIIAARASGQGCVVDAAILDGSAHLQALLQSLPQQPNPLVAAHWSRSYACADGRHITVQCLEPKFYALFLDRMGLSDDPGFATRQFNPDAWPGLSSRLQAIFAGQTQAHWTALFQGSDACVAPVLSPAEAQDHPQNAARRSWHQTQDGLQPAAAPRFDRWPAGTPRPVPARGQHGDEIMAEVKARQAGGPDAGR